MTDYQKLLDAVASYYGVGSDQWLAIANASNVTPSEWASILKQTPGVNVTLNKAGEVVSYSLNESWGTASDGIAGVVNSNTQVATMTNASEIAIPANTSISQHGYVESVSGLKTVNGGYTVGGIIKEVATGVAAVGAGVRLGAAIDQTLYNANPDFWDENGMSMLNPQTWDSLVSEYGDGASSVFNMFFGIDKNTGKTQAYMDERAFGYIAQYMASKGAFDDPTSEGRWDGQGVPSSWDITEPVTKSTQKVTWTGGGETRQYMKVGEVSYEGSVYDYGATPFRESVPNDMVATSAYNNGSMDSIVCSKETFGRVQAAVLLDGATGNPSSVGVNEYTYDDRPVRFASWVYSDSPILSTLGTDPSNFESNEKTGRLAWILQYGHFDPSGGVEGISSQLGATTPDPSYLTPTASMTDVINYLKTLYPEIWDDSIYNDVLQEDGTIKRIIYIPTGIPDFIFNTGEEDETLEVTGGQEMTQDDTSIDEDDKDLVETLLKILTGTNPYIPTPPPPTTTDYPDTGDGDTPPGILPSGSASSLYAIYNPTQGEINSLGSWLWSQNFLDQLLKLFSDPMQAIIGLHKIFATPPISGRGHIKVGFLDSGVESNLVSNQYTEVDCGTVSLKEYFGNALDYTDTDIYLYLPFVGIIPLSTADVTRSDISIKYKVDVLTGACLAQVFVNRDNGGGQLYVYAGDCAVRYPLSSGSYMGIVSSVAMLGASIAGTFASGGALFPAALVAGGSFLKSAHTNIEHSGSLSGNSGAMGIKKPYIIIRRPQVKIAPTFRNLYGESENLSVRLSSCSGFTIVKYIHIENINCTGDELLEIQNLLEEGIII